MIVWLDTHEKAEILERIAGKFKVRVEGVGERLVEANSIVGFEFQTKEDGIRDVTVAISYHIPPERITITT